MGWIAFDLDGTLAQWGDKDTHTDYIHYDVLKIGAPIPKMVEKLQEHLTQGHEVRIFTARVGPASDEECLAALEKLTEAHATAVGMPPFIPERMLPQVYWLEYQTALIEQWCEAFLGRTLPITATKDFRMWKLYDDRCQQVVSNMGWILEEYANELAGKIEYLLHTHGLFGPEGYTFPDGDLWEREKEKEGTGV